MLFALFRRRRHRAKDNVPRLLNGCPSLQSFGGRVAVCGSPGQAVFGGFWISEPVFPLRESAPQQHHKAAPRHPSNLLPLQPTKLKVFGSEIAESVMVPPFAGLRWRFSREPACARTGVLSASCLAVLLKRRIFSRRRAASGAGRRQESGKVKRQSLAKNLLRNTSIIDFTTAPSRAEVASGGRPLALFDGAHIKFFQIPSPRPGCDYRSGLRNATS